MPHYVDFIYAVVFFQIQKTSFDPFCLIPLVILLSSNNTWTIGLSAFPDKSPVACICPSVPTVKTNSFYCLLIFSKRRNIPLKEFSVRCSRGKKCWNSGFSITLLDSAVFLYQKLQ